MEDKNQLDTQQHQGQTSPDLVDNNFPEVEVKPPLPSGWFHTSNRERKQKSVYLSTSAIKRSSSVIKTIGYGLLILALFDFAQILIPPQFTNYDWEMQAISQLVERVPIPLIGLALVLYRPEAELEKKELHLLRWLSWFSLGLGIVYLSMIPLAINNTRQVYRANNAKIDERIAQQLEPLTPIKEQLKNTESNQQIENILVTINPQILPSALEDPQQVKNQLLTRITQTEKQLHIQAKTWHSQQRQVLIKNSIKWNLGALVSGILFIRIWTLTRWIRARYRS